MIKKALLIAAAAAAFLLTGCRTVTMTNWYPDGTKATEYNERSIGTIISSFDVHPIHWYLSCIFVGGRQERFYRSRPLEPLY